MATNPNFPEGNRPAPEVEERTSDEFDPNRFGKFKLNTNFFKWAISTPLPKEREEDLWHDTIPPGGVEGKSPGQVPQGPTAELKATRPGAPPRVLDLTPEEVAVLKKGKVRRVGVIALISVLFGGVVAVFVARNDGDETDQVAPAVNAANETVKDSKPISQEVEATSENPENKVGHEPSAVPEMKQETQPSGASTDAATRKGPAVKQAHPKSPQGDDAKAEAVKPQKPSTETRPEPSAPKLFGGK